MLDERSQAQADRVGSAAVMAQSEKEQDMEEFEQSIDLEDALSNAGMAFCESCRQAVPKDELGNVQVTDPHSQEGRPESWCLECRAGELPE